MNWNDYKKESIRDILKQKIVNEAVYTNMLGFQELMTDDKFLKWVEKLSDKILSTKSTYEIYQMYLKQKK